MAQLALGHQGRGHKVNILWNVQKYNTIIGMNYVDTNIYMINQYRCIINNTERSCNFTIYFLLKALMFQLALGHQGQGRTVNIL